MEWTIKEVPSNEASVKEDRDKWIGGSEFYRLFDDTYNLAMEKAGLQEPAPFGGDKIYAEYGNAIEPLVRNHLKEEYSVDYQPSCFIIPELKLRLNVDGVSPDFSEIIEIKSGSKQSFKDNTKKHLHQLTAYSYFIKATTGKLARYERQKNFKSQLSNNCIEFDSEHLIVEEYTIEDMLELCNLANLDLCEYIMEFNRRVELIKQRYQDTGEIYTKEEFLELDGVKTDVLKSVNLNREIKNKEKELSLVKENLKFVSHDIKYDTSYGSVKVTNFKKQTKTLDLDAFREKVAPDMELDVFETEYNNSFKIKTTTEQRLTITSKELSDDEIRDIEQELIESNGSDS